MDVAVVRTVALALLLVSAGAQASPRETVIVVSSDPSFVRAVAAAFPMAAIRSLASMDIGGDAADDLTIASRQLADRENATAAVVLVLDADAARLIAYDRSVDRALVRVLRVRAPLGARERAEAAHMARTMLRAARVTPGLPTELDASPPDPQASIAIDVPAPQPPLASPVARVEASAAGLFAIGLSGGVRLGAPGATTRASGDVQLIWRPDALGLAATVSLAGSSSVDTASFAGTVSDTVVAVTARLPIELASGWQWIGEFGGAVHRLHVAGRSAMEPMPPMPPMPAMEPKPMDPMKPMGPMSSMSSMSSVDLVRLDPALRLGASVVYVASPRVAVGLGVRGDAMVVREDVQVASRQILGVPVAQITVGLTLVARIL